MLCSVCQSIFQGCYSDSVSMSGEELEGRQWYHHESPYDLAIAASDGCDICDTLWRRYEFRKPTTESGYSSALKAPQDDGNQFSEYVLEPNTSPGEKIGLKLTIGLNLYWSEGAHDMWSLETTLCTFYLQPTSGLESLLPSSDHKEPSSYLVLARHWLEECLEKHPECILQAAQNDKLKLPARLLRIGDPNPETIRLWLVPEDTVTESVKYMTLSHCWGSLPFLTLTTKTLQHLIDGVPVSELPKTFRDAIKITFEMGVNLLWIDSLCIMQDSLDDWEQEASLMADVYKGSQCNLAATGSSHANEGCHYEDRASLKPTLITTEWTDAPNHELLLYNTDFWTGMFESDPLRQRAWVVQELLLSPRVLHLGKRQIIWECYESSLCEVFPNGTPNFIEQISRKLPLERIAFNDGLVTFWEQLVNDYTTCDLTNPSDKLIALSGVAKVLQRSTQHEYFAGLWNTHLPMQLLWQQGSAARPLRPAMTYRAPSWSWASVDERIIFPNSNRKGFVEILGISVEPAGFDRTAAVKSGTLRLKGLLTTIELEEIVKYATYSTYSMRFRTPSNELRRTTSCRPSLLVPPEDLHCLVIQANSTTGYDCLLLMPTTSARGQFYRWGIVSITAEDKRELDFHNDFSGEPHEWFEFEKSHGNGIYTVSIV